MEFTQLVTTILNSYISENPHLSDIYRNQIESIVEFRNEINGYGAYSYFTLKPGFKKFPIEYSNQYGFNEHFIVMEGRRYELGFLLSIADGHLDDLEIYPNDGEAWDGVVRPFFLSKVPRA